MHEVEFCEIYEVHENIVHQIEDGMPSEEVIQKWIKEKQAKTYVRINEDWRGCEFQYPGWIK